MRLQAFLARSGASPSRRKAEALITAGRVTINGATATLGESVNQTDTVTLDGEPVALPETLVYLAFNKPSGYLTTLTDDRGRPTVAELMPQNVPGLVPVGRLDVDTHGLLILTNDGKLAHRISHPSTEIEKQYRLTIRNPLLDSALETLAAGPTLEDGKMHPPKLENQQTKLRHTTLDLTIHEGRNRIIRRACHAVGIHLLSLQRIRVGPVLLDDLPEGETRPLTPDEIRKLA
jgi:pseudouridine synthase